MENNNELIKENFLEYYPLPVTIEKNILILKQMKKSICKIENKNGQGTGFFCTIPYGNEKLKVLITSNHVLDNIILENDKNIILKLNDNKVEKSIVLNENRKMYTNKKYDVTIIELFSNKDGLENSCNFLELDEAIFKQKPNMNKKSIYTLHYPKSKSSEEGKVAVSYGILKEINSDDYDIIYYCYTDLGSSGSSILSLSNNKVIGIHKEESRHEYNNKGTFLKFPINEYLENKNLIKNKIKELSKKEIYEIKYKEFIKDFKNNKFSKILFMIGGGVNFSKESIIFKNKKDYYKQLNDKNIFMIIF